MAIRKVRIYNGTEPETNIVGFSRSCADALDHPALAQFMTANGYAFAETNLRPEGSLSERHIEIRPPLTPEHTKAFGGLCVHEIVDPYQDGVAVFDNRQQAPGQDRGGELIVYA